MAKSQMSDDNLDDHVDKEIERYFSEENPKNFFTYAGAGSGKTSSLINALLFLDKTKGEKFALTSKKVAVITYTNAACDEISRRIMYKPIFAISTIHSFLWELIKHHQSDIRAWLYQSIHDEISDLKEKMKKGRKGQTAKNREDEIELKYALLEKISAVKRFTYNPNGENIGYSSLNHSEVIKMGSDFIANEATMQDILIAKYPIMLIDESQDTKKDLVDALLSVCEKHKGKFIVGMFGDTMQKIYMDGKENLAKVIPDDWGRPEKSMNYRSASRIVELANDIRESIDGHKQRARCGADIGTVRLFIVESTKKKDDIEQFVATSMAKETGDMDWNSESGYERLILEHHMAASRYGFSDLYEPLNASKLFDTALRDGTISELSFLYKVISPLVHAYQAENDFEVSKIVRQYSPLMKKDVFKGEGDYQYALLKQIENSVHLLMSLWDANQIPKCLEILQVIQKTGLFELPDNVDNILRDPAEDENPEITALRKALAVPFDVMERYSEYIYGKTQFATHQGIKGLEFPRVMVIMDDAEARGRLFSYEKLFGAKEKSLTDLKNEQEGKDTTIMRTTRLFYVACTRAQKSLAVVAYTQDAEATKSTAIENKWFAKDEICIVLDKSGEISI